WRFVAEWKHRFLWTYYYGSRAECGPLIASRKRCSRKGRSCMKPATREWVRCAEEDFEVATALIRRRAKIAANSIGFHCQQCMEKYLKARLEEAGLLAPRTHDLIALLQLLLPLEPFWSSFAPALVV